MSEITDLMTTRFVAIEPEDTLGETAERLAAADVGSALVVEYGRLIGIITSRDLVRALAYRMHSSEARVREWMTSDVAVATPDTTPEEAARLMLERRCHHLPVVEDERPIGLVGLRAVAGLGAGLGF